LKGWKSGLFLINVNFRIRIRNPNTDPKPDQGESEETRNNADPDPDPTHCYLFLKKHDFMEVYFLKFTFEKRELFSYCCWLCAGARTVWGV
jgi:hypothetical protein